LIHVNERGPGGLFDLDQFFKKAMGTPCFSGPEWAMMTLAHLQSFLLWGAVPNYALLILVFLVWVMARDWLYRLHARWFAIDRAQSDAAMYLMLGLYKLATWMLFIVPWIVLCILRGRGDIP
jgi:hypothetical protein